MTAPSLQETLAELNDLSAYFLKAEAAIKDGQLVDMSGVDKRVADLCKTVQNAIPEQQQAYLPELTALLNLLNSCELAIRSVRPEEIAEHDKDQSHAGG